SAQQLWTDRAWGPGVDRLGFGRDIGIRAWPNIDPLPGHGLPDVILNLNKNLFQTNVDLFGWGCGSLLLVLGFALSGRLRTADRFVLALAAAFPVGYSAYWFSGGPDHGARYWFAMLVPLVWLTARGWHAILRGLAPTPARRAAAVVGIVIPCIATL